MLIFVLQDCIRRASCWFGVMTTWRRILKRNTQIVLSTWSASNIFTHNSWRSFPPDLWVKFIKVTVGRKSISPCWGNTTIHLTPQLVQPPGDSILRTSHLQVQVVRQPSHQPQSPKWNRGQGRNSELCELRVAACTLFVTCMSSRSRNRVF